MSSLLRETDYSSFNLRDSFITDITELISDLRDEAIFSNYGIKVLIRIPAKENEVDEYSNFVDIGWIETTESVVPLFKDYRDNVSVEGMTAEQSELYPLQILIPSKLHLPRFSHIIFTEYNSKDEKIAREWQVLSTQMKQLSDAKTYSRVAWCVPARKETWNITIINQISVPGTILFWYDSIPEEGIIIDKTIKASGTIWFSNDEMPIAHVLTNDVQETPDVLPEVQESVILPYTYDTRSKNIINSGSGFVVGEEYNVLDAVGGENILVTVQENGIPVPLKIKVLDIDKETGALKAFTYNYTKGYSDFSGDYAQDVYVTSTSTTYSAKINLVAFNTHIENNVQEDVLPGVILKPKYVFGCRLNALFEAKNTAISVLY